LERLDARVAHANLLQLITDVFGGAFFFGRRCTAWADLFG
jgi:hypothetical protein